MPTRFLPARRLTHEKSGLARQQFFFVKRNRTTQHTINIQAK